MSFCIIPVFAFTAIKESRCPSSVAFESHMVLSETTGLDHAFPWIGVFQRIFLVSFHWIGRLGECDLPSAVGPRNWFQEHFVGSVAKALLPISFSAKGKKHEFLGKTRISRKSQNARNNTAFKENQGFLGTNMDFQKRSKGVNFYRYFSQKIFEQSLI